MKEGVRSSHNVLEDVRRRLERLETLVELSETAGNAGDMPPATDEGDVVVYWFTVSSF